MPRKHSTPAQAKRAELGVHIRARGERAYNIWVIRPPFEDEDIYLSSDGACELFYFIEGDTRFREISYSPLRTKTSAKPYEDLRFADVVTHGGQTQTVFLKRGTGSVDSPDCIRVDLETLTTHGMRIQNWRRIVPCIRRVRFHSVAALERGVLNILRDGEARSLRQVFIALANPSVPLAMGAIASLIRRRTLTCDCDVRPWSWHTLVAIHAS